MFHDVPRFPGGGVQPVQACHQLGAGRHPRRLGQPSSGDPNLGGALGSDPNPGPSRFYLYFWEKIFYIFRYILYIYMGDSKIFSPHHGQNQWLLIGCFSIRPGRQPAATRDGCSALRAAQVLGRFGSFQRAIGFHVHPGEGRMVKDGEGWWRMVKDGEGWWRMVKDGEGWWRMVKDGEGWWRMVKDGEGWWRMVKDGEGWWRMVKDGEGWWRMVKDGEGWWRMVKDGEGWWRMVKDGEGWWRMVKDGEGWWRTVKDGEGWWRMVKDGEGWWRDIDSLALQYMYIYIYINNISTYINILLDVGWYILTILEDILDDEPYEAYFLGMVLRFDCKEVAPFKPQNVKIWS